MDPHTRLSFQEVGKENLRRQILVEGEQRCARAGAAQAAAAAEYAAVRQQQPDAVVVAPHCDGAEDRELACGGVPQLRVEHRRVVVEGDGDRLRE